MKAAVMIAGAGVATVLVLAAWHLGSRPRDAVVTDTSSPAIETGVRSLSHVAEPDSRATAEAVLGRAVELTRGATTRPEGEALLRTLTQGDIPADVRAQAFRLLAQMEIARGDRAAGISDLEQVLAMINAGEAGFGHSAISEGSAMNQLMMIRLGKDDLTGAIEANAAALRLPALPRDMRANALYHHAMLTRRTGRLDEALGHARSARGFASEHGLEEAVVCSQVLEASILSEQKEWGAAVDVLRVLWDRTAAPAYADRAPATALDLVLALRHAGNPAEAIDVSRQAVERLQAQPVAKNAAENRRVRVSLLSSMVAADLVGRPEAALWALDQLEGLVHTDQSARETISIQRQAVYERQSQPQSP